MRAGNLTIALATLLFGISVGGVSAQVANPELEACRSTGLIALREHNPGIKDVSFDVDGMTVAKANTKVEDTPIKTIVIWRRLSRKRQKGYSSNLSVPYRRKGQGVTDVFHGQVGGRSFISLSGGCHQFEGALCWLSDCVLRVGRNIR